MFNETATTRPTQKITHWVLRLYQPEMRSMVPSYHASRFVWALLRSPCAESIAVSNIRCTAWFVRLPTLLRIVSRETEGALGALLTALVFGPRAAMSINARAKFFAGIYEGRSAPLARNPGRLDPPGL